MRKVMGYLSMSTGNIISVRGMSVQLLCEKSLLSIDVHICAKGYCCKEYYLDLDCIVSGLINDKRISGQMT